MMVAGNTELEMWIDETPAITLARGSAPEKEGNKMSRREAKI